jgi:hypothetical protein
MAWRSHGHRSPPAGPKLALFRTHTMAWCRGACRWCACCCEHMPSCWTWRRSKVGWGCTPQAMAACARPAGRVVPGHPGCTCHVPCWQSCPGAQPWYAHTNIVPLGAAGLAPSPDPRSLKDRYRKTAQDAAHDMRRYTLVALGPRGQHVQRRGGGNCILAVVGWYMGGSEGLPVPGQARSAWPAVRCSVLTAAG